MRRKEKNSGEQTKAPKRRWGVGKTLSVIFASVAFIVGIAILGVYLAGGFTERTTIPQDISFNVQNDPNFNSDLNRLEITSSSFELTIGSTTENVTSDVVTLGFSYTYAYNFDTQSFTDVGWGITNTGDGYLENDVLRIPRQVRIGVPFTVKVLPYDYTYTDSDGTQEIIDQIRGGISTITATSQNPDLTPISLTIAVDSPVYKTEVVLLDAHGYEITPNGDISEVVEEERFDVITKFYPAESRYIYADTSREKTSFYQPSNVSSEAVNVVYDSSTSLHFEAGLSAEGGTITAFTAVNAKVQEQVEADVLAMELTDNESIYNAYLQHYGNLARDQVLTDEANFNVVQANVKEFTIGKSGQSFKIHDQADLRIFLGNTAEAPDIPLGVEVIAQNGAALNNILANVALSFSLSGQDPTIASGEGSPILTVKGGDGQTLTPTALDGVNYYFPFINKGVTDYNNAFWDLRVASDNVGASITVTVSLLLGNAEDGYQLFDGQAEFTLSVEAHVENDVSWAEGTDLTQELLLTYDEGSTNPDPTTFLLAGLTDIPTDNIFKTVAYFVAFDDSLLGEGDDSAKTEAAITLAQQIFDGLVDGSRAGVYQTATGNRILVPLAITGDTLTVQEVGQFDLYFATVNGTAESGLYNVVRMVGTPISITVTKTLYVNSVSGAQVLFDSAVLEGGFAEVTENTFIPTISDNTEKDQIQLVFTIASDSVDVFEEEFQNGRISLIIYSGQNQINSNFTISNGQITVSEEDQTATLTYTLTANSSFTVANDTSITAIALAYNGNGSVQPINWSFSEIYTSGSLSLYTPAPAAENGVVLNMDGLDTGYNVEQALGEDGEFTTTITPGNLNLNDLISNISNNITITDQHGREDTLQNSWTFTSTGEPGSTNPLQIRPGDGGIAGQGFAFSGVGSAALGVACGGVNAANTIGFDVSAQGITKIEYDANGEETANHDPTKNLDSAGTDYSITSITGENELASVKEIIVTKYGMSGATFNLSDLVRFYVGDDGTTQYTHISFKLSPTYRPANLTDMFGENGMITLIGDEGEISENALQNVDITSLTLNHNFGVDHTITFLVTDESGAVNYTFVLNILNNTSVSAPSTVETGTNGGPLYANVERTGINATITYDYHSSGNAFPTNLLTKGFIVPNGNDGNYIISATNENAVGAIDDAGKVTFYHFFRDEEKSFAITFRPEGDNAYALSYTINFTVTRNVKIVQKKSSVDAFAAGAEGIAKYFTICQISDDKEIVGVDVNYYIGTGGDNYLVADASGNLLNSQVQVAQNLTFDYGITSLVQEIIITINSGSDVNTETGTSSDIFQQTVTLNVVLPEDDFWSDLAGDLTVQDSTATPSWQFTGGTNKLNYLVVESGQTYTIGSYQYGEDSDPKTYTISISQRDGDNRLSYYSVIGNSILYTAPSNDLLYGYGENVYTYMTLKLEGGNKSVILRVPTIISQIGTKFVSYPSQENEEDGSLSYIYDENSLDLSKQTWSQLYADAKYNTVTAGREINLRDFINLPANANFNITTSQSFTIGGSAGGYVQNAIGSLIYDWTGQGALTLNHLSSAIEKAYLFIEYTISTASGSESFGYLFKVEPSVVLDEPNYPYGGAAEYITMSGSETLFDLDETFDSTTVQNGHSRFEVYQYNSQADDNKIGKKITNLLYKDQVVSVRVGTQTYTDPSNWAGFINARIDIDTSDTSSTRDHSFLVLSSLNTTAVVEIVVRRTYDGGGYSNGQLSGQSVVGGTIDYHFVLNDNRNYTIRVKNGNNIQDEVTNYTWNINNWASSSTRATENSDEEATTREETIYFYLLENWDSGSASSGNVIRNTLYFNLHNQDNWELTKNDNNSFIATSGDLKFTFNYDNSGLKTNGTFTVTYPEYLSQDYSFSATLYTDHGALSEVTFVFHADANAQIVKNSHAGGRDVSIGSIFEIYTSDGNDQPINIDRVTINSYTNGGEDLKGFVQADGTTIQLASTVGKDIVGNLTLTVSWSNRSYTFTIPNFTITANITQKTGVVFGTEIGGQTDSLAVSKLLNGTVANATISMEADTSNSAIASAKWNSEKQTFDVTFNQVGAVKEVPMTVTVTVKSGFSDKTTTITINVTFKIYPSVRTYVSYPNPTGNGALKVEYIENGTTFADFGENFLDGSAIFADNARVNVEYAQVVGGKVVYNSYDNIVDSVVITKQDGFNYFTVQTSSTANGTLRDYTGSITINGKTLNYVKDSGYDITDIPTGTEIRLTSSSFSGSINKFAVTYNKQTTTAISKSDTSTILPDANKRVTISNITNAVVTDVATDTTLRTNSQVDLDSTIMFTRGTGGGTSSVTFSISYNSYMISYVVEIVDTAFVLTVNQASNNISSDSVGQYETLYVDKTDSNDLLAKNRMLRATLSSGATDGDYYIFFVENGTTNVLASKIINLSENFVNNSRDSTIYIDLGNNGLSSVVLGSESGQYTPVMILDAVYDRVLSQENNKEDALVYIAKNYNNPDATITLTNYFDSTFTNASLSSRVTMTYGGDEVAYDKFSSLLSYYVPGNNDKEIEKSFASDDLNIAADANIGTTATTAITKFSFGYSNGGAQAQWEEYTSDIPATDPTYTYDNDTGSYALTGTAGTEISISTKDLTGGKYYRVIYNNSYYYSNTDGQIVFTVVKDVNTFRVEKFVEKTTSDIYSITKEFQASYRYLADLDIVVGAVSDNGGSVKLQANQTINLVKEFNVRRKTTGEQIQMSDMVSGNANFILTTVDNTNEVGNGARYLGISAVRTDEEIEDDRTTYDWIITGNGADNDGQDVSLTLTYVIGDFEKTFNLTVHVMNDYSITFDGSGDLNYEGSDGNIPSNKSPYRIDTSAAIFENRSAQILLAGESTTINGGSVASTPYMSITHKNASGKGERSVLDFSYTITTNQISGDTTYNIPNNINAKLEMSSNNWTESTTDNTTTYTWNKGTDRSLVMNVNQVVFGSQYYRIELVDEYGYTIYLYFTLDSGEDDPEIYTTSDDSSLSLTEGETVAFGAQYQSLSVTANNNEPLKPGKNELTITASPLQNPSLTTSDTDVSQIINIINIDAWGFNQDYATGDVAYFVGKGYGADDEGYIIDDDNIVGDDGEHTFILSETNSQEPLKLPNFRFVTIDNITYYYNNGGSLIEVGTSSYANNAKYLATASGLNHANNISGNKNSIYKSASDVSLTLPSVGSNYTWIYGNSNQASLTMVVRLKYAEESYICEKNTKYSIGSLHGGDSITITSDMLPGNPESFTIVYNTKSYSSTDGLVEFNKVAGVSEFEVTIPNSENSTDTYKYEIVNNTEYFDISQNITLSKTTQMSEQNNLVADNVKFDLKDYINVTAGGSDEQNYTIYDDTLAVAIAPNSRTSFDLIYGGERVSYSLNNANYGWERLYYRSLSERFNTVLTSGTIKIVPKDQNATFYYGLGTTGNNPLSQANETSFVKVANVDYFTVETYSNNEWTSYDDPISIDNEIFEYNDEVGGYPLKADAGATVTVPFANANYRIRYNNTYYYPAQTLEITDITEDRITIANKKDMSSGTVGVDQYYVIQRNRTTGTTYSPYRYRASFTVTGTYQSVSAPNTVRTLPINPDGETSVSVDIGQWAQGVNYTQVGASYQLSFTKAESVNTFTVSPTGTGSYGVSVNGSPVTASGDSYTIPSSINTGETVNVTFTNVESTISEFAITYNGATYTNAYRATLVENSLANYNGDNLYFVITSGSSGTGGTGLATIDSATGAISILPDFTADHFVTVQIYQKVSGIDGSFSGTDVSDMYLLAELRIYPEPTRQISGGGITLSDYLPEGTYYENESYEITVPASTTADLVVYNGTREINRISLANDTDASVSQTFTTATLLGSAVNNYDSTSGITLKIENASSGSPTDFTIKAGSGTATNFTEGGNTINFGQAVTSDSITFNNAQYLTKTYIVLQTETLLFRSITFENKDYQAN